MKLMILLSILSVCAFSKKQEVEVDIEQRKKVDASLARKAQVSGSEISIHIIGNFTLVVELEDNKRAQLIKNYITEDNGALFYFSESGVQGNVSLAATEVSVYDYASSEQTNLDILQNKLQRDDELTNAGYIDDSFSSMWRKLNDVFAKRGTFKNLEIDPNIDDITKTNIDKEMKNSKKLEYSRE